MFSLEEQTAVRYGVQDFVGSISNEQRDWLDAVLEPGERILWATRLRVVFWSRSTLGDMAVALLFLLFSLGFSAARVAYAHDKGELWGWPA